MTLRTLTRPTRSLLGLGTLLAGLTLTAAPSIETLPPLLTTDGGVAIDSAATWDTVRRPQLLELFRANVYGRDPIGRPKDLAFIPLEEPTPAFDGLALRRRVRIDCRDGDRALDFVLHTYRPASGDIKGCFILIVHRPRGIIDNAETNPVDFWPVPDLVARGYATAAFHIYNLAPDRQATGLGDGVFAAYGLPSDARPSDAWGAIAAWGWGASRALDYLETEPALTGLPFAVIGHSRGGKASLWCGARDERFALTISNDSGCTGAALARTTHGETVKMINDKFTHWFAPRYRDFNDRVDELPVDQHMLIALTAPRRVYVASAEGDAHADPRAEFQACVEAGPAFGLFDLPGVGSPDFPAVGEIRHDGAVAYHLRAGEHDLKRADWSLFMDYMDRWFPRH